MSIRSLYLAASKGCTQVGETQRLFLAALEGHTETVECLIQSGTDVNIKNVEGESPLHFAALKGHTRTVEYLIQSGADVNVKNEDGTSPLHFAAVEGHTETVEYLMQSGTDVNLKNEKGTSPLHFAALKGHTRTVEYLIQSGADVNIRNDYGKTPLHFAAVEGHTETVEYLIQSGADVNVKNEKGTSPLHFAALKGHTRTVEYLIQSGADVNVKNEDGTSPIHLSCSSGSISISQICECLLKYGAYVNSKDKYGMTALHYASQSGDKECVATLLEHGSDIDITDGNDRTAFDLAVDDTADYFASHVLKLRVANLYVSEINIRLSDKTQTSYPTNELKDQFVRELKQMRSETIFCNITFYDIFIKGISSKELYTMNENSLKGLLKSSNWETKFSMYNTIIKSRFRSSIERKVLLELANRSFNSLFNRFAELPHECAEHILSYLSNENLKNFINASEPLHKEW
ncbi:serine/threonine-protein phosphatase 6 regulatory ankyrin repeat subunit A-like [Artemia franciscana]|uniref:serine/threonine-protein phosphatase 6 regulatory ankyrin repeat subunit A-like n=1 Tax=Artemia franciscana TaxID=6661 RepID=UPI0032DBB492